MKTRERIKRFAVIILVMTGLVISGLIVANYRKAFAADIRNVYAADMRNMAVSAESQKQQYQTAYDLWQTWKQNGEYPNWFCGAWTEQSMFYMGILEASENAKEQVLSVIADKNSVTFVGQKYSYNTLVEFQNAIVPQEAENGVVAAEIDERNNRLEVALFAYMTENERAICRHNLESKYSDRINIDDEAYRNNQLWHGLSTEPAISSFSGETGTMRILWFAGRNLWIGIGVVLTAIAFGFALVLRKTPVQYTADGRSVSKRGKITNEDIVRFVKDSRLTTSGRLDEMVSSDIEKFLSKPGEGGEYR